MVKNTKLNFYENLINKKKGQHNKEDTAIILSEDNKKVLLDYVRFLLEQDLAQSTIEGRIIHLKMMLNYIKKDVDKITKQDIKEYVNTKRDVLSPSSFNTIKSGIKVFFKWFYNFEEKGEYPDLVKWIQIKFIQPQEIHESKLITVKEVQDILIPACETFRDKALISVMRETGARINEILQTNISDVKVLSDRAFITLRNSKRRNNIKDYRERILIDSYYYLQHWLREHRLLKDNPNKKDVPLFLNKHGERMQYHDVQRILANLKRDTKFTKPLNPHWFRHSQATDMAKVLTDAELRIFGGWTKYSQIVGRYTHITSDDVNHKILKSIGRLKEEDMTLEKENLQSCPRCNEMMDFNKFKFCGKCGMTLQKANEMQKEDVKLEMINEKIEKLFKKFKEQEKEKILKQIQSKKKK